MSTGPLPVTQPDPTRLDQIIMSPKADFLKCNIKILDVVKFTFKYEKKNTTGAKNLLAEQRALLIPLCIVPHNRVHSSYDNVNSLYSKQSSFSHDDSTTNIVLLLPV